MLSWESWLWIPSVWGIPTVVLPKAWLPQWLANRPPPVKAATTKKHGALRCNCTHQTQLIVKPRPKCLHGPYSWSVGSSWCNVYMFSNFSLNNSPNIWRNLSVKTSPMPSLHTAEKSGEFKFCNPGLINHQLAMLKFHHDAAHCIAQNPVQSTKLFFQNAWTGKPRYAGWLMVHGDKVEDWRGLQSGLPPRLNWDTYS